MLTSINQRRTEEIIGRAWIVIDAVKSKFGTKDGGDILADALIASVGDTAMVTFGDMSIPAAVVVTSDGTAHIDIKGKSIIVGYDDDVRKALSDESDGETTDDEKHEEKNLTGTVLDVLGN